MHVLSRMVGRHAPCANVQGSICRGVRRGPERRRHGLDGQAKQTTNLSSLSGLSVGVASNRRCHVGEGGPNAILSGTGLGRHLAFCILPPAAIFGKTHAGLPTGDVSDAPLSLHTALLVTEICE